MDSLNPHTLFTSAWSSIIHKYSPRQIEFFGTLLVQLVFYWVPAVGFTALDYVFPRFSARHKLQPAPKQPTFAEIRWCTWISVRNQLQNMSTSLVLLGLAIYTGQPSRFRIVEDLPSFWTEFIRDLVVCTVVRDVMFYYVHRMFHTPRWYKAVHKFHHEFTAPVALAAQHAHPVEQFLANTVPVALPPLLLGSHILTTWAFIATVLIDTTTVHSGYDFFYGAARKHDAHHEKFNLNYGTIGVMDWLYGTDGRRNADRGGGKKEL